MFFKSSQHQHRFMTVIKMLGKIWESGVLDSEYAAACYIFTADSELWEKSQVYISHDGIEVADMLNERDFSSGYRTLVLLASNLFNNNHQVNVLDFLGLDEQNLRVAITAISLRKYPPRLVDIEKEQGEP